MSDGEDGFVGADGTPIGEADAGAGNAGVSDSDAGNPDAGNPDAGNPDAGNPDAGNPGAGNSDAGNPGAGNSDAGNSDAGAASGTSRSRFSNTPIRECTSPNCCRNSDNSRTTSPGETRAGPLGEADAPFAGE
jgi:PPE-repeat protein